MSGLKNALRENVLLTALFLAALAYHLCGVFLNWTVPFLSGHEFRQAQTAITSYYIDQQDNFGLLYETPILGKPWVSILLEVPIYEWCVVLLSRATGMPHFMAARTVSVACFYLMLPAAYLLLARIGLTRPRRLLVLALILTCPAYIYYTRSFLMDPMELMCCVWFLLGFVRTMDQRSWGWLLLTNVAGVGAALIKSATFAVWLWPAAGYGAWVLWREVRPWRGWSVPLRTIAWGAATIIVPLGLLRAWVMYTDPIKAAHASAWIFTSKELAQGNWGLFNPAPLFTAHVWEYLLWCWDQAIMSRWIVFGILVLALVCRRLRGPALVATGLFFLPQFLFPFAYAYQDYYFYSCAIFLHAAFGFLIIALLDSRAPRWVCVLLLVVPFAAQVTAYWRGYRTHQSVWAKGGFPFTEVIRDLTPKDSVIIVAGADWAAMVPLYSERKALMIRNGLEWDIPYQERAYRELADETVSAMVLQGDLRQNRNFINLAAAKFGFDPAKPTFSWVTADVYVSRLYRQGLLMRLRGSSHYPEIKVDGKNTSEIALTGRIELSEADARVAFANFSPAPFQVDFQFGMNWMNRGADTVLSAHPDSDLWLRPPADAKSIRWSYGIFASAYEKPEARTNGVEFIVLGTMPDGQSRQVYYRLLDPVKNEADRGDQHIEIPYTPLPGEVLQFSTRPNDGSAFDWAYWIGITVR